MTGCLNESMLQAWLDGELSPEASAAARSHLAGCALCAAQASAAEQVLALLDEAWQAELPALIPTSRLRARVEDDLTAQTARVDRLWWWPIAFGQWQIGAAIVVLVIAGAGAVAFRLRPQGPPSPQTAALVTVSDLDLEPASP